MGRRITLAGATAAVMLAVAGVATGLGTGGSAGQGPGTDAVQPTVLRAASSPVSHPRGRAVATRATRSKQVAIRYFETKKPLDLPPGMQYFVFSGKPCPRNAKAISGYSYYAGSQLPPELVGDGGNAPRTLRNWQFYLSNPNPEGIDEAVKFGVICAKHVG